MIVLMIVGGLAVAFLSLSLAQNRTTFNASVSDMAFHVAEAGIDDSINKMNAYAYWTEGQGNTVLPSAKANADFAVIGIPVQTSTGLGNIVTGGVNSGTYSVEITPPYQGRGTYTLRSTGIHGTGTRGITTIVVPDNLGNAFRFGLFGDQGITGSGGIFTDGYSSSKGSYANQAIHNANGKAYADPTGSIATNHGITLSGNASVFGDATPGPGLDGTLTRSGNAMVLGSSAPATLPVVNAPQSYAPPIPAEGDIKLTGQGTTTITDGTYRYGSISTSGQTTLALSGNVTLYVDGNIDVSGGSTLMLLPGAKVKIYQSSAGSIQITGGGLVNTSQIPGNFRVYSASTSTVDISGNSDFYGAVYAPQAFFKPSGGEAFFGAFVSNGVQITGGGTFHYDEDLGKAPSGAPVYKVKSYTEFVP
jgi:hypothetical protein